MAAEEHRFLQDISKSVHLMMEDWKRIEHSTSGMGEHLTDLIYKIKFGQRSTLEYLGQSIKIANSPMLRQAAIALGTPIEDLKDGLTEVRNKLKQSTLELEIQKGQVEVWRDLFDDTYHMQIQAVRVAEQHVKADALKVHYVEQMIGLQTSINKLTGRQLSIEYLTIRALREVLQYSGELNTALINANSNLNKRFEITEQVMEVQARTGASTQAMLGAAKALSSVWPKLRGDFKSTLEVVVEMEAGLGVSVENSTQLAKVFEVNLKSPVRDIADRIAVIANNTSLMADEAARFATEIGKGLRLLGEGGARQAREVAGYVTMMAGRMKDVGGDAEELVKMFNEMASGTSQGFLLRGMSGVRTPGAVGTEAGARQAVEGVGRLIDRIVTAGPGTAAFSAQLQAASEMLGISAQNVALYKQMLREANKPLSEQTTLQQRWNEQTSAAGQALQRLESAFTALIQRSFGPFLPFIAKGLGAIADFIGFVASHKATLIIATTAMVAAVAKTTFSLFILVSQLHATARAALEAAAAERIKAATSAASSVGMSGGIGALVNIARRLPVLLAFAVGYAIGTALDQWLLHKFPRAMQSISEAIIKVFHGTTTAQLLKPGAGISQYQFMADVRKVMAQQGITAAGAYFREHIGDVNQRALVTEKGVKALMDQFVDTAARYRESIGLKSVTSAEKETLENDRKMIEETRQVAKNTGEANIMFKKIMNNRLLSEEDRVIRQNQEILLNQVNSALMINRNAPVKLNLTR